MSPSGCAFCLEASRRPSLQWADRVRRNDRTPRVEAIAEEVRIQTAQVARIDGAVSGTPFLIALVPGYMAYLWQEAVMERRMAALYGHDPRELETCARTLVLRGVHPTIESARSALPRSRRRRCRRSRPSVDPSGSGCAAAGPC